ncbi:hypothetical protein MMC07_000364 [Pseudocyphellaria aurata]|nr:hypothetical protein [Pseudocyphellaria aurata]
MELSRSEYPALLGSLQPGQAVPILEERVKLIGKINADVADWLTERRRIEEAYAQGLKKLASRRPQDPSSELGVFQTPWRNLVSSTDSLAQSHGMLAQKIETDVERPLRDYISKNREAQAMSTIQGNLASVAKDLETAQRRAEKIKSGKSSATKIANATADVNAANQMWESQAPYVFERLQALDENRVNHLRDVLTQLQTHELDQLEKSRVAAENCLNTLLNVDTADEISAFIAKSSGSRPQSARQHSRTATNSRLSPPHPTRPQDDGASEISSISAEPPRPGPSPVREQRRTPFGGLKRLGTVMGRRRQNSKSADRPPSPEKRSRGNLNPLRRGTSSKNMQTIPSPEASVVNLPSSLPRREPASPPPSVSKPLDSSQSTRQQRRINDERNGDTVLPAPSRSSSLPVANGVQSNPDQSQQLKKHPTAPLETLPETRRDPDGFNIPQTTNDEISRAQQEAGSVESEPQFKLDIRNEPIHEEDGDARSALSNVANTLRAQAQQAATPRKPTANRGRRDVRNTVFIPSPNTPDIPGIGDPSIPSSSPFGAAKPAPLSPEPGVHSDAQSVRSLYSMSSGMNAFIKHPEMHRPGLNVSIVETVSALFSDNQITKAAVLGELALAHNVGGAASGSGTENVRLENFPALEKVAVNPTFVTQLPSRSGEYSINLAHIARTTVAFKYQVHLEEANLAAHAPIALTPTWKLEPTQASVVLYYSFNPAFVSPLKRSVTLKNVTVLINVENTKTLSCLCQPMGTFKKEKSMIVFELGEVTLDGYAEGPQKVKARFGTESEAKAGSVEVRWEITGDDSTGLGSGLGLSQMSSAGAEGGADPFADEGGAAWKDVAVVRKLVSGKYFAH